jgi:hypothetical protein
MIVLDTHALIWLDHGGNQFTTAKLEILKFDFIFGAVSRMEQP